MFNSKETLEEREPLPSLPVRWFIFFRLYPSSFLQPTFLFDILVRRKRYPILWDNVMVLERKRLLRKKEKEEIRNITL